MKVVPELIVEIKSSRDRLRELEEKIGCHNECCATNGIEQKSPETRPELGLEPSHAPSFHTIRYGILR